MADDSIEVADEITRLFDEAEGKDASELPAACQTLADTIRERAVQEERLHKIRLGADGGALSGDAYARLEMLGALSKFLSRPASKPASGSESTGASQEAEPRADASPTVLKTAREADASRADEANAARAHCSQNARGVTGRSESAGYLAECPEREIAPPDDWRSQCVSDVAGKLSKELALDVETSPGAAGRDVDVGNDVVDAGAEHDGS
eukprot:CAMPEP_0117604242 /NCGR_PEP_ID=MMETSP0784-20121206/78580_1 /TAXON_ID=39447 /ORGANISM="" /LENGTH=208 /DNA_ID=CAMNT_0005407255 /DNA_START=18 /DNA_END=640 /DNA_ORIENTATION=-